MSFPIYTFPKCTHFQRIDLLTLDKSDKLGSDLLKYKQTQRPRQLLYYSHLFYIISLLRPALNSSSKIVDRRSCLRNRIISVIEFLKVRITFKTMSSNSSSFSSNWETESTKSVSSSTSNQSSIYKNYFSYSRNKKTIWNLENV